MSPLANPRESSRLLGSSRAKHRRAASGIGLIIGLTTLVGAGTLLGTNGEILYACYIPASGTMYRIKTPGGPVECHDHHVEFSWNAEGPQGPPGPPGPEGPAGPAGPPGISGYEIVEEEWTQFAASVIINEIPCPSGKKAIAGGFRGALSSSPVDWAPRYNYPDASGTKWIVALLNRDGSETATFFGYAVCAVVQ